MPQLYDWSQDNKPAESSILAQRPQSMAPSRPTCRVTPSRHTRRTNSSKYSIAPSPIGRRAYRRPRRSMLPWFIVMAIVITLAAAVLITWPPSENNTEEDNSIPSSSVQPTPEPSDNNTGDIVVPDWITQNFIPVNEYSRPGDPVPQVNGVVVHYVGNPGTTAEQNRSYFANLAQTHETWASSHFVVGIDGTIVQCVPLNEIAYCSNNRNADTISIECCHPDDTGEFTQATQEALIDLLNWLIETYNLDRESIIRHYDVNGKECPRYYVQNPAEWDGLLDKLAFPPLQ